MKKIVSLVIFLSVVMVLFTSAYASPVTATLNATRSSNSLFTLTFTGRPDYNYFYNSLPATRLDAILIYVGTGAVANCTANILYLWTLRMTADDDAPSAVIGTPVAFPSRKLSMSMLIGTEKSCVNVCALKNNSRYCTGDIQLTWNASLGKYTAAIPNQVEIHLP